MAKDERDYEGPYVAQGELGATNCRYKVKIITDGTRTIAEVYSKEQGDANPIGVGHAVRREGDKQNPTIGVGLATGRALVNAGQSYLGVVEEMLEQ